MGRLAKWALVKQVGGSETEKMSVPVEAEVLTDVGHKPRKASSL